LATEKLGEETKKVAEFSEELGTPRGYAAVRMAVFRYTPATPRACRRCGYFAGGV